MLTISAKPTSLVEEVVGRVVAGRRRPQHVVEARRWHPGARSFDGHVGRGEELAPADEHAGDEASPRDRPGGELARRGRLELAPERALHRTYPADEGPEPAGVQRCCVVRTGQAPIER